MLEWILASVWANYKPHEFLELDGAMQALIVAAYETNSQIEAVVNDSSMKEIRSKSSRKK